VAGFRITKAYTMSRDEVREAAEELADSLVKEHGVRDGVKQTIIQRPTKVTVNGEDY